MPRPVRTETAAAAAPFAVNSFFTGPGSFTAQSATQIRQDRAGGATLAEQFAPAADPTLALPLAGGRGYWLVGVLTQTGSYSSDAGIRKAAWPDGSYHRPRASRPRAPGDRYLHHHLHGYRSAALGGRAGRAGRLLRLASERRG